ncbi:protein-methionine-sulfoxide reductase catalytic subunit MsrP [Coralloluteibacterium stylophorae]|uniref:Protein-methionine-sulfoxide reductase catalytic subunit MsrP n=1 Tax=Coralloluteibacterium stylophorae TaxID=1776034 RepID=A0A8J7VRH4_9GAMM|nr:protein-methionine-sulfoxide reductase catalytic subunit MsrP [Coralloluteibacterium stylophorae]MBS7455800.1 protein-methionine-sulfoxide reductase catalytic subunit MsrP [Coralloluteibacterium stylophorae]
MLIRRPADVLPSEITPEPVYRARRQLMGAALATPLLGLAGCAEADTPAAGGAADAATDTPDGFRTSEEQTRFANASTYNNFYEFGTGKADPAENAHTLQPVPWSVTVGGAAGKRGTFALEDLLKDRAGEERIYRMRCVEAWSMVIPWLGMPLGTFLRQFEPTSNARYVRFVTLDDPRQMPGLRYPVLDWPYEEGLRIDEAMHPLAFLAVGMYGRPLPNQNGAPLRLVVPWKYGFKGIKSIVRIEFTEDMPPTSWNKSAPREYGFFANVNPAVAHPRWSQASERRIAGGGNRIFAGRIPTRPFNGYAEQVAPLYAGMDLRKWF